MAEIKYNWVDNPTASGVAECNTDILNDCLMHLKYDNGGGTGLQMFDTILKDHVLTYEESKGLALQGTYVYKDALAGSRYGYPDFYAKVIEEYNEATETETVNGVTVKVHSNGHKFYDIANKSAIDDFFNTIGSAWFYGVDTENERIFLPRDKYFAVNGVAPVVGNGIAPVFSDGTNERVLNCYQYGASWGFLPTDGKVGSASAQQNGVTNVAYGFSTDATKSGIEAHLTANKDKYLYICVGNTTNYEGVTDVVNQGMEILEQVAQKVNIDATNLNSEGKSLIAGYAMPSSKYINLTLGASGTTYTAPANGYFYAQGNFNNANGWFVFYNGSFATASNANSGTYACYCVIPCKKGETVRADYNHSPFNSTASGTPLFRFIYAEGEV